MLSIAGWIWVDSFVNDDGNWLELSSTGTDSNSGTFAISPTHSSGGWVFSIRNTGGTEDLSIPRPSAGAWHHCALAIDLTIDGSLNPQITSIWIDAVLQSPTALSSADLTGTFGNYVLYVMARNNASRWISGNTAEISLWAGYVLVQADVNALYFKNGVDASDGFGVDASTIHSGNLHNYWQVCGTTAPETAKVGGVDMTVNGATSVAHPISGTGICPLPIQSPSASDTATVTELQSLKIPMRPNIFN